MQLTYDSETNTLRLTPSAQPEPTAQRTATTSATLDIGPGGRLIGIEFQTSSEALSLWRQNPITANYVTHDADSHAYIQISPGPIDDVRSTDLTITTEHSPDGAITAIVIPRRGTGHEISYPSGNQ